MSKKLTTKKGNGAIKKIGKARKPGKKKKSADELMLEAWKYTYETRHKRLTQS